MAVIQELTVRIGGDLRGASTAFRNVSRQANRLGEDIGRVGRGLTASLTLPLLAAAGAASRMGSNFDDEFAKIVGLVGIGSDEVQAFRAEILRLAPAVGRGPQELAEALFVVTSAGARGRQAMEILTAAAKGASAGMGETKEVARAVTAAVATFGDQGLTAAEASDIMTASVRAGNLEASSLAGTLGNVISTAKAAGASFADVGGAIAVMSRQGISTERATTALNAAFQLLIKTTPKSKEALAAVGLTTEGLRKQMGEEGLLSVLRTLEGALQGDIEALGEVVPSVEALRGVLSILGQDTETVNAIFNDIANSTGVLEEAFDAAKTPGFRMRQAFIQLQTAGIQLADAILPAISTAVTVVGNVITRLIDKFQNLTEAQKSNVLMGAAVVAGLGPMLVLVGGLVKAFGLLTGVIAKSLPILGAIATPLGILVAALTAAIGVAFLFRDEFMRSFNAVRDFLRDKFVTPVANGFDKFIEIMKLGLERMVEFIRPILETLGIDIDKIFGIYKEAAAGAADGVKSAFGVAGDAGREVARRAARDFGSLRDKIKGMFDSDLFEGLTIPPDVTGSLDGLEAQLQALIGNINDVGDAGEDAADDVTGAFDGLADDIGRSVGDAVTRGRNLLESLGDIARRVLSQLIGNFITGQITSALPFLGGGKAAGGRLQPGVPTLVGERGPELVTSRRPLTVMNAADSRNAMGRGGLSITIGTINADDAVGVRRAVIEGVMEGVRASSAISREQLAEVMDTGI